MTLAGGSARRTSRAAEPERWHSAAGGIERYHLACYESSMGKRLDWSDQPAA
ncbi:MAG: hypothetical protein ACRDLV_02540 [Solirubrobacteraceae bacterium]